MSFRIGYGYDVHQLAEGEDLVIGGLMIPHTKGSVGHSDADVLLHVMCDAMLGALALGDIGTHFPDTDPAFKGIDSKILLKRTWDLVQSKGWALSNMDTTVCLQQPKFRPAAPRSGPDPCPLRSESLSWPCRATNRLCQSPAAQCLRLCGVRGLQ